MCDSGPSSRMLWPNWRNFISAIKRLPQKIETIISYDEISNIDISNDVYALPLDCDLEYIDKIEIKRDVDFLYTILPFETDFYAKFNMKVDYVGNPLCDSIESYPYNSNFKTEHNIGRPYIALLPGSRMSELKHVLPNMLETIKNFPEYDFILAGANHISDEIYKNYCTGYTVKIIKGQTYDVLKNAHAGLVCSGTATLETALLNCPQVVCFRFSKLSYFIGKLVIKVKYISLVNLIMDKAVVEELIQDDFNEKKIASSLRKILTGQSRLDMIQSYAALKIKVGNSGASERTAKLIVGRTQN